MQRLSWREITSALATAAVIPHGLKLCVRERRTTNRNLRKSGEQREPPIPPQTIPRRREFGADLHMLNNRMVEPDSRPISNATAGEALLAASGLVKSLGGKRVVDGIDLTC